MDLEIVNNRQMKSFSLLISHLPYMAVKIIKETISYIMIRSLYEGIVGIGIGVVPVGLTWFIVFI